MAFFCGVVIKSQPWWVTHQHHRKAIFWDIALNQPNRQLFAKWGYLYKGTKTVILEVTLISFKSLNFSLETAETQPLFQWCVFVRACIGTEKQRIQKLCKLANIECANHWTQLQCLLDGVGKTPKLKVMVWTASPHYFQSNWFCCSHHITLDLKRKKMEVVYHLSLLMDRNINLFSMWDKWTKYKVLSLSVSASDTMRQHAQLSRQHCCLLPVWVLGCVLV